MRVLVNVNKVTLDEKDKLNAGEYNIHEVEFEFSEEYNGLIKKATFSTKEHAYLVEITDSSVIIPYEVLEETGDFEIGAFGYDTNGDELILRYSPSPTYVHVDLGSYRDNFDNYKVPTADVVEQLTKRIEDAEETVQGYDGRLTATETKLETIETGAEVNIIEDVKVNGTSLTIENKSVNVPVPTKTSDLNNDSGYITKDVNDLTNYTTTTDMNTAINNAVNGEKELRQQADTNLQNQIDAITSSTDVVDVVGTYQELQEYDTSKLTNNDVIKVLQDNTHNNALSYYRWIINGTGSWNYIGSEGPFYTKGETDTLLNTKQNTIDASHKLSADYVDDSLTTNKFTSTSEKTTWNAKYDKPSGGIPKTDLSSAVQTSLGKADTAIQDVSDKEDKSNKVTSLSSSSTDTQYPSAKLLYDKLQEINDELYNNSEVSGTGENLTLNNTGESILKLDTRGQCKQDSTTGKQLINKLKSTTKTNGVTYSQDLLSVVADFTTQNDIYFTICDIESPTTKAYTISFEASGVKSGETPKYNLWGSGTIYTLVNGRNVVNIPSGTTINHSSLLFDDQNRSQYTNTSIVTFSKFMLVEGEYNEQTMPNWEEYTGNQPSPSPDFPQQIHEVSGDNEVVVCGKNLVEAIITHTNISAEGEIAYHNDYDLHIAKIVQGKTYTITTTVANDKVLGFFINYPTINSNTYNNSRVVQSSYTFTASITGYVAFRSATGYTTPMLNEGSTALPYEPYNGDTYELSLGDIKMRGIGTYEDYFVRNSGKNLFDKNAITNNYYYDENGTYTSVLNTYLSDYIEVNANESYTFQTQSSGNTKRVNYFDSNKTWLSQVNTNGANYTFTTPNNAKYIRVSFNSAVNKDNIQIEKGSTATTYEPYGTGKWCKYNAIGKTTFVGSNDESWNWEHSGGVETNNFYINIPSAKGGNSNQIINNLGIYRNTLANNYSTYISNGKNLNYRYDEITNVSDFKTFLGTKNMVVIYQLATPYLSLIEDETLIEQLEAVKSAVSYDTQTNVSQTNNDLPFILDIIAFKNTIAGKIAGLQYENELLKEKIDELEE